MVTSLRELINLSQRFMEMNFDGLVGPTHNFAGLSFGNTASTNNAGMVSSPRRAVLEGLAKMSTLHELGIAQGILPPQSRPRIDVLRRLGFEGDDAQVLQRAQRDAPHLLAGVYSASPMWAANAATVSPSKDTVDGRVHFTPANLLTLFHRSLEGPDTARALRRIFPTERFVVHDPLPSAMPYGDEGAANHIRFHDGDAGVEVFVYGRASGESQPRRYPARQTLEACQSIVRRHGVRDAIFLQQSPAVIDEGAFHNDVVSVGHERVLLWHEDAFADPSDLDRVRDALGFELVSWRVARDELTVPQAVSTYLFNSQIVTAHRGWVLIAPRECEESDAARAVVDRLKGEGLADVIFLDVRQSMRNGGGPACLRLRVELTDAEHADVLDGCVFSEQRHRELCAWAEKHYRESLAPEDLVDPALIGETREALDALTGILGLGSDFYAFQR